MQLLLDGSGSVYHPPSRAAYSAYYHDNARWPVILDMLREHLEFCRNEIPEARIDMPPSDAFANTGAALRYAMQFGPVCVAEHDEYIPENRYSSRIGFEGEISYASTPAHAIMLAVALMLLEYREAALNEMHGGSVTVH